MMSKLIVNIFLVSMMGYGCLMSMQGATPEQIEETRAAIEVALQREAMKEELKKTPRGSEKYQELTDEIRQKERRLKALTPAKL